MVFPGILAARKKYYSQKISYEITALITNFDIYLWNPINLQKSKILSVILIIYNEIEAVFIL